MKPDPPIPADVDLRGMAFMPLDVNRLRDSDLAIEATGEEFRAAVMLWCASWNQIPAGSLPNADTALAAYAGFGRDIKGWKKVREGALRGFIECSDGRLYHLVVTEKAMEAWAERVEYREIKENEKTRKQREREDRKRMFEALRVAGIVLPYNVTTSELRSQYDLIKSDDDNVTGHALVTVTGHALDTAKTGTGTGTGTGIKDQKLLVDAERQPGDDDQDSGNRLPGNGTPPCPHQAIVEIFHKALPELPAVVLLNDTRRKHLQARWRDSPVHQDTQFWVDYFLMVKQSKFLMGQAAGRDGGKPFKATFDWLINASNFVKVIEGNYHA
ncbi:MAG: YdaU family protein [Gammaproteobacteria bacterium]|nr:YdaU family protein [Gammaproteobacteria bacterium]MBU0843980.1 YdaU family protein [Gammaproteobacteria bacterium]